MGTITNAGTITNSGEIKNAGTITLRAGHDNLTVNEGSGFGTPVTYVATAESYMTAYKTGGNIALGCDLSVANTGGGRWQV